LGVFNLGHTPGVILSGDAEKKRVTVSRRETEGYVRWKEKHGDAPSLQTRSTGSGRCRTTYNEPTVQSPGITHISQNWRRSVPPGGSP
jgi:hypothetical protein